MRFFKIFVAAVEPKLGMSKPVLLIDFPLCMASLSKAKPSQPELCERFELYIRGIELANGFTELNDPDEQLRRFEVEKRERQSLGSVPVPKDESFLEALKLGMPPSGGVALGFDRLFMLLSGETELKAALPFLNA